MSEINHVSLLGIGSMGAAMTTRLLEQSFEVAIWNRSAKDFSELTAKGAKQVELEQALQNDIFISFLSNDASALELFTEENLAAAKPGSIHLCMSTLSLTATKTLAERHEKAGVGYLATPVLGRPAAILSGKLLIVVAGKESLVGQVSHILEKISAKFWNVGEDHGKSVLVKLGVNYNLIHALQAIGESVALVESGGVDPNTFVEIITHTAFTGSAYVGYGPMIVNRNYTPPGFSIELGLKDMKLIEDAASDMDLKLPVSGVLRGLFEKALDDAELRDLDWSAIAELTRQRKL